MSRTCGWARIWCKWGLQPWRRERFKFSTDPELETNVRDVVGLYLNPPDKAVVLSIDEKSQIQALHATTTLFAALEVATGKVTDACYSRHRHEEFVRFLKYLAKTYPRVKLHVVADNYATLKHPNVQAWVAKNPRITMSASISTVTTGHELGVHVVLPGGGEQNDEPLNASSCIREKSPHFHVALATRNSSHTIYVDPGLDVKIEMKRGEPVRCFNWESTIYGSIQMVVSVAKYRQSSQEPLMYDNAAQVTVKVYGVVF